MPTILIRYPDDTLEAMYDVGPTLQAIEIGGVPLRENKTPYKVEEFGGGLILDGCPINRILYGSYSAGQKALLDAAGKVCYLDAPATTGSGTTTGGGTTTSGSGSSTSLADELTLVPDVPIEPIVIIPTGEPITTAVLTGVATVLGAIFGIFGGGVPKAVQAALNKLRDSIVQLGQELIKIGQALAAALRAVLGALQKVYEKVIKPVIDKIEEIEAKIGKILDRILRPYLDLIQRIRQIILNIYGRFFLPIIRILQRMRQAIALLRILHVPGMQKLDQKLAKIEGKLTGVIQKLLQRANDHSGLLNILLRADMILQHGVFLNSAYVYQGQMQRLWWDGQTRPLTADEENANAAARAQLTSGASEKELNDLLASGKPITSVVSGPSEQSLLDFLNGKAS